MFRESFVLELIWENKIDFEVSENINNNNYKKISFLQLVKKYFSKKLRKFLS